MRARDVFLPLRSPAGRRLAGIGLVQVALTAVGGLLVAALAREDYWRNYAAAMQSAMQGRWAGAAARSRGPVDAAAVPAQLRQLRAGDVRIPWMLFSGARLGEAVQATLQAGLRNLGANLLAGVLFIGALLAATLAFALVALVLGAGRRRGAPGARQPAGGDGRAGASSPACLVLLVGGGYLAWRDTFGEGPAAMPGDVHGIEV